MTKLSALILAAGHGTRMRPLTYTTPKPLLPIAGKPIIVHTLEKLKTVGINDIYILVNKDMNVELFRSELSNYGYSTHFIIQGDNYGTGAAVLCAEPKIKNDFLVIAGDSLFDADALNLLKRSDSNAMLVKSVSNVRSYGDVRIKNGIVQNVIEKPKHLGRADLAGFANISLYKFSQHIFDKLKKIKPSSRKEYEITDALKGMYAINYNGFWMDIAYPWHLLDANKELLKQMKSDYYEADIHNTEINGKLIAESGVSIRNSVIEGDVYLGKNVKIGPHSYIRGPTMIWDNSEIGDSTTVKNSIIFRNTKAKHLSYIGDSIIGNNVNFGSGTQLANYRFDAKNIVVFTTKGWINSGRNKLGAIVGDNTKFGVLSSVMPGKLIGNDCWIGSGVILGQNVEPGSHILVRQNYSVYMVNKLQNQEDKDKKKQSINRSKLKKSKTKKQTKTNKKE